MGSDSTRKLRQLWPLYVACYVLWLGLSALGAWLIFQGRAVVFDLAVWLRFNPWAVHAIAQFAVVTFGLVWLAAIIVLEQYLRQGVVKNRLWHRAARVVMVEAVALGVLFAAQALLG
jgi:hypothetical protein